MSETAAPDGPHQATAPRAGGVALPALILGVLVLSVAGSVFDLRVHHTLGIPFDTAFVLASLAAAIFARRDGLVVAMFAPPLVLILAAAAGVLLSRGPGGGTVRVLLAIAAPVLPQFPVMATTTAATLVIGTVRLLRRRQRRPAGPAS